MPRIESRIDGLKALLNDPESDYKIIDVNFHIVDRDRWLNFVEAFSKSIDRPRLISVQLIRYKENGPLTLAFAERKLQAHTHNMVLARVSTYTGALGGEGETEKGFSRGTRSTESPHQPNIRYR